jgi:hypothetical protein
MLDRVVNVYPDWQRLIRLSAERGRRLYGLVYPRDTPFVRAAIFALTSYCADRSTPRSHHDDAIEAVLRESGLSPQFSMSVGPVWQVAVYRRHV